jgi:outer membrane protein TolC
VQKPVSVKTGFIDSDGDLFMELNTFKTFFFTAVLVAILAGRSFSQTVYMLTLDDCRKIAAEKNFQMKTLKEDFKIAGFELKAAVNRFKTQVSLDLTVPDYTENISSLQDSAGIHYFPVKQAAWSGNLQLSQPLPTDGNIYVRAGAYHIRDFYKKDHSVRLNTRLGLEQPLEAFYSYNRIKSSLRLAELNYEMSRRRLTRARLDVNYTISQAFYNLHLALERAGISAQTLALQTESYALAQNKYKAGVIAEVEALQMEVDLGEAQNDYDMAITNCHEQEGNLKQLLAIALQDSLKIIADLTYEVIGIDLDTALKYGLKNRLEIREREIQTEQSKINIASVKVNQHITGRISAYYDLVGVRQEDEVVALNNTFDSAWDEMKRRPGNRGIALFIEIPLLDWGVNRAKTKAAIAELNQANMSLENEKVNVERDIRATVTRLTSSLKRLQLLEKNVTVAERSFAISKQRFANGDINSQSLALDRNRLSQAYHSRLNALIDYKLLLADLTRKTFYDFEAKREIELQ